MSKTSSPVITPQDSMHHPISIYYGLCDKKLKIISSDKSIKHAIKFSHSDDRYFLLNSQHELFVGKLSIPEETLAFTFVQDNISDFECYSSIIYIITKEIGYVYKAGVHDLVWIQIFKESDKKFREIKCNNNGMLLKSSDHELLAKGDFGKLMTFEDLSLVTELKDEVVVQISAGLDFALVITQKSEKIFQETRFYWKFEECLALLDDEVLEKYADWENVYEKIFPFETRNCVFLKESVDYASIFGNMIHETGVSSFGKINKGQLGTGDHIKREKINSVGLNCIKKITSCNDYSTALSADGSLYIWGDFNNSLITSNKLYESSRHILDVTCTETKTFVLTNDLKIHNLKSNETFMEYQLLDNNVNEETAVDIERVPFILAAQDLILVNHFNLNVGALRLYTRQQAIMQRLLKHFPLVKPTRCPFISCFMDFSRECTRLLHLLLLNLKSMHKFIHNNDYKQIIVLTMHEEFTYLYLKIWKTYFDNDCFDPTTYNCNNFLSIFIENIKLFIEIIQFVMKNTQNIDETDSKRLLAMKSDWLKVIKEEAGESASKLAEQTKSFWLNEENVKFWPCKLKGRRMILDSNNTPLKLLDTNIFSTSPRFVLFSDVFSYHSSYNQLVTYPLQLIWISDSSDIHNRFKDKRKYAFNIKTPEEELNCYSLNAPDQHQWLGDFKSYILMALEKEPDAISLPLHRFFGHTFSERHVKYGKGKYIGMWYNGRIDGMGEMDLANISYKGELYNGDITGFGQMTTKKDESTLSYEGDFMDKKYHGFGKLRHQKASDNSNYSGYFQNDVKSGYGSLSTNEYQYNGDFVNNAKEGFGVIDDKNSGAKYIGMFMNNKKSGSGILITTNGVYYAGVFVNDILNASPGLVIFPSGIYYKGELTMEGPSGKGKFYYPQTAIFPEEFAMDDTNIKMSGHTLTGTFSGTWEQVKILAGIIHMGQTFNKVPTLDSTINAECKWTSIFACFSKEIFGCRDMRLIRQTSLRKIWNKIAIYVTRSKRKEKIRSNKFVLQSADTLEETSAAHILDIGVRLNNLSNLSLKSSHSDSKLSLLSHPLDNMDNLSIRSFSASVSREPDYGFLLMPSVNIHNSSTHKDLNFIPNFCMTQIDKQELNLLKEYLNMAFRDTHHPLYSLFEKLSNCFYSTYSCWKFTPNSILCEPAMNEWISIVSRIYHLVLREIFPALPAESIVVEEEIVSYQSLLYPILMTQGIYSALFVLYASKCCRNDEIYRQRILICEKKTDENLVQLLNLDGSLVPVIKLPCFQEAIDSLKKFKEKCCPSGMMEHINEAFELIELANSERENEGPINADVLLELVIILIIKSNLPQLGAEISLLEDLMQNDYPRIDSNTRSDYYLTTLKASYQHIVSDKFFR